MWHLSQEKTGSLPYQTLQMGRKALHSGYLRVVHGVAMHVLTVQGPATAEFKHITEYFILT